MKVTIVGGGNVGTQFAVHYACKGYEVNIFTTRYKSFSPVLRIIDENGSVLKVAEGIRATDKASEAFEGVGLIFVTVPAFCMKSAAEEILPYVRDGLKICLIPGTGGGECAFMKCMERGAVIYGLQRVPSVARLEKYGDTVRCSGYRDKLVLSAIPGLYLEEMQANLSTVFEMKCEILSCYLAITMTPSNPILHTTRLYSLFKDYEEGKVYKDISLFYEGWDDASSELLLSCDDEVRDICRSLPDFDLSGVRSLREHYESKDAEHLTRKIKGIASFKGLRTPSLKVEGGWIPDFSSRYFTADFPYGLSILKQLASIAKVETPNMNMVMDWYRRLRGSKNEFSYSAYGINSLDDLKDFYLRQDA